MDQVLSTSNGALLPRVGEASHTRRRHEHFSSWPGRYHRRDPRSHREPRSWRFALPSQRPQSVSNARATARASSSSLLSLVPEPKIESLATQFPVLDPSERKHFDLAVVGAGPAGLAVAYQVAEAGLSVCCIDPAPQSVWPNNYGVWIDEFEQMGLVDCIDYVWPRAVVYLDDDRKKFLDRPYGRVNRRRLKTKMGEKCAAAGVLFHKAKVEGVTHDKQGSFLRCADGACISTTLVLDATGFSRRLIQFSQPFNPGYQAAWGIVAQVDGHPFDLDCMVFMDWRDSHLDPSPELKRNNHTLPTFLYAMPLSPTRIFLEETSLVARPAVPFDEIQRRMELRMEHLGIRVRAIEEEEYCLIPMGGVLPSMPQRVLGIGGTAGMVHPSTGYMVSRALGAAPAVAQSVISQLQPQSYPLTPPSEPPATAPVPPQMTSSAVPQQDPPAHSSSEVGRTVDADEVAAGVWRATWPVDRQEQRAFFCFGMDVLLRLDLAGNRRFFDAFFDLSPHHWQGFLSSRLSLPELIGFGLSLFSHATNVARLEIMAKGTPGLVGLLQSLYTLRISPPPPANSEQSPLPVRHS